MMQRSLRIIVQIGVLFLFFLIGSGIQKLFKLIIPGSVIGLVLLFLCLFFNILPEMWVKEGASLMTRHLILFFIPATVGIMNYFDLFIGSGFMLVVITIVSSLIVLVTAGFVSEKIATRKDTHHV